MKEKQFIKSRLENWRKFEKGLAKTNEDPKVLSELYAEITDDLAYAQTHYKNRKVRYYLNGLAQKLNLKLYKHRPINNKRILTFWTQELPAVIYHSRKSLLASLFIFVLAVAIGAFSAWYNIDFVNSILGVDYVNMTLENIEKGDPMAVYKKEGPFGMFGRITLNNIFVSFRAFAMGVFAGLGTISILLSNGIMLGSFQYFFAEHDVLFESAITIWQHGTIEIASIIIAGGAGLVMGSGWFYPGTYTRLQGFINGAKRGTKIIIGLIPLFIIAGFIESFITRLTEAPTILRVGLIIFSLVLIIGYFVVLPYKLPQKYKDQYQFEGLNARNPHPKYNKSIIHKAPEIFSEGLRRFIKQLPILLPIFTLTFVFITTVVAGYFLASEYTFSHPIFEYKLWETEMYNVLQNRYEIIWILALPWTAALLYLGKKQYGISFNLKNILVTFFIGLVISYSYTLNAWINIIILLFFVPILISYLHELYAPKRTNSLVKAFSIFHVDFIRSFGTAAITTLVNLFFTLFFYTVVFEIISTIIDLNLPVNNRTVEIIINALELSLFAVLTAFLLSFMYSVFGVNYENQIEIETGENLMSEITQIGKTKRNHGLEME